MNTKSLYKATNIAKKDKIQNIFFVFL